MPLNVNQFQEMIRDEVRAREKLPTRQLKVNVRADLFERLLLATRSYNVSQGLLVSALLRLLPDDPAAYLRMED